MRLQICIHRVEEVLLPSHIGIAVPKCLDANLSLHLKSCIKIWHLFCRIGPWLLLPF